MPELFGESSRTARYLLERAGLRVGSATRAPSEDVGEGLVAATDPPAESVLPRDTPVSLLISTGGTEESYVMPDVLGREIGGARRQLEALGFRVFTPPAAPSVGTVVCQEPPAGSRITRVTHDPAPGHGEDHPMTPHPVRGPIVAPSILSADFSRARADERRSLDPARDWLHCDVMDNHFVPNLTFGPLIIGALDLLTPAFLDVHLMIETPERDGEAVPRRRRRRDHRPPRSVRRSRRRAGRGARDRCARPVWRSSRARRSPPPRRFCRVSTRCSS